MILRQDPLSEQVYRLLRARLRDGGARPGEPMVEAAIVRELAVSRTPVREALSRLAAESLLEPFATGFRVPALNIRDMREIFELRQRLEPAAFAQVVADLPPSEVKGFADDLARALSQQPRVDAHHGFRTLWLDRVKNRRLASLLHLFEDQATQVRLVTLAHTEAAEVARQCGAALVAAVRDHDGGACDHAMTFYLAEALRLYEALGPQMPSNSGEL